MVWPCKYCACPGGGGEFSVVLADIPWKNDHAVTENRAVENLYPTMIHDGIEKIPVSDICTRSAVLYFWVTSPKLQEGLFLPSSFLRGRGGKVVMK
ncbi:hypothetical protein CHISP_3089 [Chitinispirillum alkaliphilum]|nr:hypothetical protein CHISP_3089 [Chitinispirillum alkaliphilum]